MLQAKHIAVLLVILLLTAPSFAQDKEKIKFLIPTEKGSTGLFHLYTADTLRQGELSFSVSGSRYHRQPGDLKFYLYPVSFVVGVHDRIELFASWEAHKRIDPDFILPYKFLPSNVTRASTSLIPAHVLTGTNNPPFRQAWYNDTPFLDVPWSEGAGDFLAGMKFNLASERFGNPIGFSIQPLVRVGLWDDSLMLRRGQSIGTTDFGFDAIVSKNIPGGGTFTVNAGVMRAGEVKDLKRQHYFNYGLGFSAPLGTLKAQFIAELLGTTYFGDSDFTGPAPNGIYNYGTGSNFSLPLLTPAPEANPVAPVDIYAGLRLIPHKSVSISGALGINARGAGDWGLKDNRWGWFVQAAFSRKINRPPTIECSADKTTVIERDSATVRATATDEDDDTLSVAWRTSGGKLTQQENSAVFDSTGLTPGKYTVTAEVTDGEGATATCTSDITVEKRKVAPTISCGEGATIIEGESATLRATAADENNDALTYTWTVDGQAVTNNSPEFTFGSAGKSLGAHTVAVTVTDVDGMTANCSFTVTINRKPNRQPTVSLTLDKSEVYAGDTVNGTAQGSDPDNDPLTYAWTVDGQSRPETGTSIAINTSGMAGGSHTVGVTVRDDRDGTASDTKSFSTRDKIVIPIDGIRPNNVAKARLDEIALRLQQDPRLRATITGYHDDRGSDRVVERTAQRRADAAKDYLVKQHKIDEARIEVKNGGKTNPIGDNTTAEGRKQNRRVEIELFVP